VGCGTGVPTGPRCCYVAMSLFLQTVLWGEVSLGSPCGRGGVTERQESPGAMGQGVPSVCPP